eukprot:14618958-Alexandrium_andersonii.AAC.1
MSVTPVAGRARAPARPLSLQLRPLPTRGRTGLPPPGTGMGGGGSVGDASPAKAARTQQCS